MNINFKGQHLTEEFKEINPSRRVPAIKDGEFNLPERCEIDQNLHRTLIFFLHFDVLPAFVFFLIKALFYQYTF